MERIQKGQNPSSADYAQALPLERTGKFICFFASLEASSQNLYILSLTDTILNIVIWEYDFLRYLR